MKDYGEAWEDWPIEDGDVWTAGGDYEVPVKDATDPQLDLQRARHVFVCGDLETGIAHNLLLLVENVDMVYCDPPWNSGLARQFRQKADRDKGYIDFVAFLKRLVMTVRDVHGPVYIEMGEQHIDDLERIVTGNGGDVVKVWDVTYYNTKPSKLLLARFRRHVPSTPPRDFTGMDDEDTPLACIRAEVERARAGPEFRVFDPCMGTGLTGWSAHEAGVRSVGVELHPRRLAHLPRRLVEADDPVAPESVRYVGTL